MNILISFPRLFVEFKFSMDHSSTLIVFQNRFDCNKSRPLVKSQSRSFIQHPYICEKWQPAVLVSVYKFGARGAITRVKPARKW